MRHLILTASLVALSATAAGAVCPGRDVLFDDKFDALKATWGEQLILGGGMGLVSFLATALPIALLVTAAVFAFIANLVALGLIILVACIMYVMAAAVVLSCLSTIYRTALYVYSSTGALPSGFTQTSIEGAFRQKQPMFRGRSGR